VGSVPMARTDLRPADTWGAYKARWGIGRINFHVPPGLYGVGNPTPQSPVFVTANYKMSFDRLRSQLAAIDSWILVLDTRGINVWCAAGKGTFGTDEIIKRIADTRLPDVVENRRLIVPQLGAPGIAAHVIKERTGFRVIYGPVRAADIPAFLAARYKATPEMRRVEFPFLDRVALIPNDLIQNIKYPVLAALVFLLLSGFGPDSYSLERLVTFGTVSALLVLAAYLAGTVLPPALLPWLPGRAFAVKGVWVGLVLAALLGWSAVVHPQLLRNGFTLAAWFLMLPAVTSFIAMNFTGSSTYTSLSGVVKELRIAIPVQISAAFMGVGLWVTGLFM
jgi:acetyl-CoA decarbonylase/synthase complex subunit gamma